MPSEQHIYTVGTFLIVLPCNSHHSFSHDLVGYVPLCQKFTLWWEPNPALYPLVITQLVRHPLNMFEEWLVWESLLFPSVFCQDQEPLWLSAIQQSEWWKTGWCLWNLGDREKHMSQQLIPVSPILFNNFSSYGHGFWLAGSQTDKIAKTTDDSCHKARFKHVWVFIQTKVKTN